MATASDTNTTDPAPTIDINAPYTPRRPAPVISVSINHPLATAFKKVKNFLTHKQTLFSTSVTIRVTPIVALVSFFGVTALFGGGITTAFNIGKTVEQRMLSSLPTSTPKVISTTPTPLPVIVSREGTIKATYQLQPTGIPTIPLQSFPVENSMLSPDASASSSGTTPTITATPTPSPTPVAALHYVLVSRSGLIVFLTLSNTIPVQRYIGLHVLITGSFDSKKNTLYVTNPETIEILQ